MIRVLHLFLWIVPGGGGIQAYRRGMLAAFAGDAEIRMLGAAVNPGADTGDFAESPHLGVRAPRWRNLLSFGCHVWRMARRVDVVQIHGMYGPQFLLGALLCRIRRVPYIVNPHGGLSPWFQAQHALRKRAYLATLGGFLLRGGRCLLATSEPEAAWLMRRFPGTAVRLVHAGVEVPERPSVPISGNGSDRTLRLLYLGSFDPWKRIPLLVRAVAKLRAEGLDVRATVCGGGPAAQQRQVRDEVARLGLDRAVTLGGDVRGPDKLALLTQSHVFVLPSVTEGYSLALAEALAQGLPAIITEGQGAAPEVRRHGCGTVIPADDEPALVAALRRYGDPALRREHALAAHRYAREVLDLPRLRDSMTALYRELAAKR